MEIEGSLVIKDKSGRPRIVMSANEALPFILVIGENGHEVGLEVSETSARMRMQRPNGSDSVIVSNHDSTVSVIVFDDSGRTRWTLLVDEQSATVRLLDDHRNVILDEHIGDT